MKINPKNLLMLLVLMQFSGCQGLFETRVELHPLDSRVQIHSTDDGELSSVGRMISDLSKREVVFLGETHLDDVTHRFELAVLRGIQETGRDVVVSLEMFGRDRQSVVEEYLAGVIDEDSFLEQSNPWNNYETGYRPILEWAKEQGVPVIAANVPSSVWRKVAFGGGLSALEPDLRSTIADELLPNTERYWQRYDRAVRGHGHTSTNVPADQRLEKVQSLWDNTMGESVVRALDRFPGSVVVHINGAFHSREGDGAARQVLLRRPDTDMVTVHIIPSFDLNSVSVEEDDPRADWIVHTEVVARGQHSGSLAVFMPRTLRYLIETPARSAGAVPLLIWLADENNAPADEMKRLRTELGENHCLVVVEPMYSTGVGGGWIAKDHRDEDLACLAFGLQRLRERLLAQRNLKKGHVILAGSGAGAEALVSVAIGDPDWPLAIAQLKEPPGWFAMEGLPDPPTLADQHPGPGLQVIVDEENGAAWQKEATARAEVGAPMEVQILGPEQDATQQLLERLKEALGS